MQKKKEKEDYIESRKFEYKIYKNRVWFEVIYKGVPMTTKAIYEGRNRKDCERWMKENVKKNR